MSRYKNPALPTLGEIKVVGSYLCKRKVYTEVILFASNKKKGIQ
jgi:hypothetical protein